MRPVKSSVPREDYYYDLLFQDLDFLIRTQMMAHATTWGGRHL